MHTNSVHFKKADIVSIFSSTPLAVVYPLSEVTGNKLYLEYEAVEGVGLAQDVPILDFKEVSMNL